MRVSGGVSGHSTFGMWPELLLADDRAASSGAFGKSGAGGEVVTRCGWLQCSRELHIVVGAEVRVNSDAFL